jgi:diguanylate cyclase (GGDEF)-like protein
MPQWTNLRIALAIGAAWLGCAAIFMSASQIGGSVILLWVPNGIWIGALFLLDYHRWPLTNLVLYAAALALNLFVGMPPVMAAGIALANLVEAPIVAALAKTLARRKRLEVLSLTDMMKFAGTAFIGALASGLVALTVRPDDVTLLTFGWWVASVMLGTLIVTPLVLYAWRRIRAPRERRAGHWAPERSSSLWLITLILFVASMMVLQQASLNLLFVPMAITMYAVVRHSHVGASAGVLAFAIAAAVVSFGGHPPAAFITLDPYSAGFLLQVYMLVLVGSSMPIAGLLTSNDRLAQRLSRRNQHLRRNLNLLNMAEKLAGIGRWQYHPRTGREEWSRELLAIVGEPQPGTRAGLPQRFSDLDASTLYDELEGHRETREQFNIRFDIEAPGFAQKTLAMCAMNEFDADGMLLRTVGVVRDVTEDIEVVRTLSAQRAKAVKEAAQARKMALTDELTGLPNRRCTLNELNLCVARAITTGENLSVIMFDVDHFKRINDTHGHHIGDAVLKRLSDLARLRARERDLIGRTGGEEFVWILPDTYNFTAFCAAERLREIVAEESGGALPAITISAGVACWTKGDDAQSLLERADKALYEAKELGRDQVRRAA